MSTQRPNFFIVGAPKAGTTSLSSYLGVHPQVFMPENKEPNFFAGRFIVDSRRLQFQPHLRSEWHYLELFEGANEQHKAIGEASVSYLRFPEALEGIKKFNPRAKIIVMLRNPIDLVQALHAQLVYEFRETEHDFARAWRLQSEREKGRQLPKSRQFCDDLLYGRTVKLGEQLERLLQIFPPDQVKIILFEDFVRDTQSTYFEVLDFLQIRRDERSFFPAHNQRQANKWERLARWHTYAPLSVQLFIKSGKRALGIESLGIRRLIKRVNTTPAPRVQLEPNLLRELEVHFAEDIARLESLLKRDLNHWR